MITLEQTKDRINGIDVETIGAVAQEIAAAPEKGMLSFRVHTAWTGQTRSETMVEACVLGGQEIPRRFKVVADEPFELLGTDSAPNPQELLMTALNACMVVGYVANAALRGITLKSCRIETRGTLDLRGFLGLADDAVPGYRQLDYVVHLDGDGTRAQYEEIHRVVSATSPNFYNLASAIEMNGTLA